MVNLSLENRIYFITLRNKLSRRVYFLMIRPVYWKFSVTPGIEVGSKFDKYLKPFFHKMEKNTARELKETPKCTWSNVPKSTAYSNQQNGTAKRVNWTLNWSAKCMLADADSSKRLWLEDVTIVDLPLKQLNFKIPRRYGLAKCLIFSASGIIQ